MQQEESFLFPLDFDALEKGQLIGKEQLERIFGFQLVTAANQKAFGLKRLGLIDDIRRARPDLLPVSEGDGIRLSVDNMAVARLGQRIGKGMRAVYKATSDLATRVEVALLSPDEVKAHDHQLLRGGNAVAALHRANRATRRREVLTSKPAAPVLEPKKA